MYTTHLRSGASSRGTSIYMYTTHLVILTRVRENKYGSMGLPTRTTARRDLYVYTCTCILVRPFPSRRREKKEGLGFSKKEFFRELELDVLMALAELQ